MKPFFAKLHYSKITFVTLLLLPFSFFYRMAVSFRNYLYDKNIIKPVKLDAFVISVGNLTTGGTGKTPVTSEIANYYTKKNKKVAVISRGYGGKLANSNTNIISDGENIFFNAEMAGDEPYWIATNSPRVIVITGKNRINSGKLAIDEFNAEILILDDGFQHRKLHRNLDIVLVDPDKGYGNGFMLPAGPLREPKININRAHRVITVNKSLLIPEGLNNVIAFTGIAQPDSFFKFLKDQGVKLISKKVFPDHHLYTKKDLETLIVEADTTGAEALVTTEKDMVKINNLNSKIPVYALKLKVDVDIEKLLN